MSFEAPGIKLEEILIDNLHSKSELKVTLLLESTTNIVLLYHCIELLNDD